ncbi:MAG: hypothetical protein IPG32_04580 [Saprospirales bacterium]|nr:hypothetical protein [Saprospirales bacterium]
MLFSSVRLCPASSAVFPRAPARSLDRGRRVRPARRRFGLVIDPGSLDEQAIAKLDPGAIWSVDRPAVKRFSTSADLRSDFTLAGAGLLAGCPAFLALEQKPFRNEGLVLGRSGWRPIS